MSEAHVTLTKCSIPDLVHSSADMPFENFWFMEALVSTRNTIIIVATSLFFR